MNKIISPKQVEDSTVLINCNGSQGTGFFINNKLILTARHVIEDCLNFGKDFLIGGENYNTTDVLDSCKKQDLCIIKSKYESIEYLPLVRGTISYRQPCSTFGFPSKGIKGGRQFEGKVNSIQVKRHWDFSFEIVGLDEFDYSGVSGSAIVSNRSVIGITLIQRGQSIHVISIRKAYDFLIKNEVTVLDDENLNEIPLGLKEDINRATPNYAVYQELGNKLETHNGWFLCYGVPGSGKTTIIAGYDNQNERIEVLGRYFTKIPQDTIGQSVRVSRKKLMDWLESVVSEKLGYPIEVLSKIEKRIERIPDLLNELAKKYESSNCVLFIDGLDEVDDLDVFLGIFPLELPKPISIVLSCTSEDILPIRIKNQIKDEHRIKVTALHLGQCEFYLREELKCKEISTEFIQKIAIKSEGHPLYLRYLVNYLNSCESLSEIELWIEEIPSIGGEISRYYDVLWDDFFRDEGKLWIIIIMSQLRSPVIPKILLEMLPDEHKLGFYSNFSPIKYLFKDENNLELYHASFRDYIFSKVPDFIPLANDQIFKFCNKKTENSYSIENQLYHLTQSSKREDSLVFCCQSWADKCALSHVNPELIIQDIKKVIAVALDLRSVIEVLRLLLLLHRIEFRYESVLAEYANYMARALIAMGEDKAAVQYLIRENNLLVTDEEAIECMQLFSEKGQFREANRLSEILNSQFRFFVEEKLQRGNEFSVQPFLIQAQNQVLSMHFNKDHRGNELIVMLQLLKNYQDASEEKGYVENAKLFYDLREYACAWQIGYTLRIDNFYQSSEFVSKYMKTPIDSKWTKIRALSVLNFNTFNLYGTKKIHKTQKFKEAIEDIEWLIDNYGYENDAIFLIIAALIDETVRFDIVDSLIDKYLQITDVDKLHIKDANGVDINWKNVNLLYNISKMEGYIGKEIDSSFLSERSSMSENCVIKLSLLVRYIGKIEGELVRCRTEKKKNLGYLQSLIEFLSFTLKERAFWNRSYFIPETIIPFIYGKLAYLIATFFHESIDWFVSNVCDRAEMQLGLYSEGYRDSLTNIIQVFLSSDVKNDRIEKLIELLDIHTQKYVQNRWERTPELLRITEYYSLINQPKKAKNVFKSMLNTSMGPSWYKEAQMQLLNTTLSLKNKDLRVNKYLQKFASLLDAASGEMTFQRYIRYEKESFIGDILKLGETQKAIDYLKFETIPPIDVLINNAEREKMDNLDTGLGNNQGANNLSIQSGVLEIINHCEDLSPFIRIALCSIFTINDDTYRYVDKYGYSLAVAMNEVKETKHLSLIFDHISEIFRSRDLKEDHQSLSEYVDNFHSNLNQKIYDDFWNFLNSKKDGELLPQRIAKNSNNEDIRRIKKDPFEKFNELVMKENLLNSELIEKGLNIFKQERVNFWLNNWSNSSYKAKKNIKELFSGSQDVLENLKPFIKNIDIDAWLVVDQLIGFLNDHVYVEEIEGLYKVVTNHFDLLIRPEQFVLQKYEWISSQKGKERKLNNKIILNFIIWLLNYPLDWIKDRSYEALLFLAEAMPVLTIKSLIEESLSNKYNKSGNICAEILVDLSSEYSQHFIDILTQNKEYLNQISSVDHLSIFKCYLDIGKRLAENDFSELLDNLLVLIPDSNSLGKDVLLDEERLYLINDQINALNDLQILDRSFCEKLLKNIEDCCAPFSWLENVKADEYLRRSYSLKYINGRYSDMLKFSLNKAIMGNISKDSLESAYCIINFNRNV